MLSSLDGASDSNQAPDALANRDDATRLIRSGTRKAHRYRCVAQTDWQDMPPEVKSGLLLGALQNVRVHGDDVLEAVRLGQSGPSFQAAADLASFFFLAAARAMGGSSRP